MKNLSILVLASALLAGIQAPSAAFQIAPADTNSGNLCPAGQILAGGGVCIAITGLGHLDGADCASGNSPIGVDEDGAVQSCFDVNTQAEADSKSSEVAIDTTTIQVAVDAKLPLAGGTMSGAVDMDSNEVIDISSASFDHSGSVSGDFSIRNGSLGTLDNRLDAILRIESPDEGNPTHVADLLVTPYKRSGFPTGLGALNTDLLNTLAIQGQGYDIVLTSNSIIKSLGLSDSEWIVSFRLIDFDSFPTSPANPCLGMGDWLNPTSFTLCPEGIWFAKKDVMWNPFAVYTSTLSATTGNLDLGADLDVSGAITVGGLVDGQDLVVLAGTANDALPKAGGTMTGALGVDADFAVQTDTLAVNNGNVGIGTSSPEFALDMRRSATGGSFPFSNIQLSTAADTISATIAGSAGLFGIGVGTYWDGDQYVVAHPNASILDISPDLYGMDISVDTGLTIGATLTPTSVLRIESDGDIGIGTTSPSAKLDVAGSIAVSGTVDGIDVAARDHDATVSGDITHDSTIGGTTDDAHFDHADDLAELNTQIGSGLVTGAHTSPNDDAADTAVAVATTSLASDITTVNGTANANVSQLTTVAVDTTTIASDLSTHEGLTGASAHGDSYILNTGDTMTGDLNINADLAVQGSTFVVQESGLVGIGTSAPEFTLDIRGVDHAGGGGFDFPQIHLSSSADSLGGVVAGRADSIGMANGAYWDGPSFSYVATYPNSSILDLSADFWAFNFYHDTGLAFGAAHPLTSLMIIESGGDVGIGTTDPTTKLDVNGTINSTEYELNGNPLNIIVVKEADELLTSNNTLQDDDELFATLTAGATYSIDFFSLIQSTESGAPDSKHAFTWPATSTTTIVCNGSEAAGTAYRVLHNIHDDDDRLNIASSQPAFFQCLGSITVGATGGTLQYRWAQQASNPDPIVVLKGSMLKLTQK